MVAFCRLRLRRGLRGQMLGLCVTCCSYFSHKTWQRQHREEQVCCDSVWGCPFVRVEKSRQQSMGWLGPLNPAVKQRVEQLSSSRPPLYTVQHLIPWAGIIHIHCRFLLPQVKLSRYILTPRGVSPWQPVKLTVLHNPQNNKHIKQIPWHRYAAVKHQGLGTHLLVVHPQVSCLKKNTNPVTMYL